MPCCRGWAHRCGPSAVLVICFSTGLGLAGWRRVLMVVLLLASSYVLQFNTVGPGGDRTDLLVTPLALVGLPALAGALLHRSRAQTAAVKRLTLELAVEREHHTEAAVLAERQRIARELHDVISHSVSIMVVQAGAAAQLTDANSPVGEPIRVIRATGKEALGELRRQLGVLHDTGAEQLLPLPGLADIPDLVATSRAQLTVLGDPAETIPAGVALATFRIIQEALTQHTTPRSGRGGSRSRYVPSRLIEVVVEDAGAPGNRELRDGFGLRGMRERVELYGGRLEAGPTPGRPGWQVRAELPVVVTSQVGR